MVRGDEMGPFSARSGVLFLAVAAGVLGGCREGEGSAGEAVSIGVLPSPSGANGCVAPAGVFAAPVTPTVVPLAGYDAGPAGQVTAAGEGEVLYLTAADGGLWAVDVSDPSAPIEESLVTPGVIDTYLSILGAAHAPALGGLRVLDAQRLVVIEAANDCLLAIDRFSSNTVSLFAGDPAAGAGYLDGDLEAARFDLTFESQPFVSADSPPEVWVADTNNHALRRIYTTPFASSVTTAVGGVGPGAVDGPHDVASLDSPTGITATCVGLLLITESGGHLRALDSLGNPLFGWQGGELSTLAMGLDGPVSPLASAEEDTYWVDASTGVLKRYSSGGVDCPLQLDCGAAVAAPSFTPGALISLTRTPSGALFALDASTSTLYHIDN